MEPQGRDEGKGPVLHIVVVGFHHKKGCQVEFSYPPLMPDEGHDSNLLPEEWKYLPFLALPDGAHNYQEDTVYFHLPPLSGDTKCVYGVSCYRQIEAKPLYGLLQAKLQLITHAYFEEKDFSQISILKELYDHMNSSLRGSALDGSQVYLGMSPRDLILHFRHKALILFKLILLEKKVRIQTLIRRGLYDVALLASRRLLSVPFRYKRVLTQLLRKVPVPTLKNVSKNFVYFKLSLTHVFPLPPLPSYFKPPQAVTGQGGVTQGLVSGLEEDQYGLPLAIFTKGYLCLPYMALQQHHLLSDVTVRGFVAGATNILFRQQRHLSDAIVEVEEARIQIQDPELRKMVSLTTADLRFADYLVKHVTENRDDVFLDGTGWEGGDEWIRAQFTLYLHSLLSSALQQDSERLLADYGAPFITAWKITHNYRVWYSNKHPGMTAVTPGSVQNSERGKKIGNAMMTTSRSVVQTGKAVGQSVGGALTSAKTAMSTWFSTLAQPAPASTPACPEPATAVKP
uniref:AVL9 homolog (S. cerevisiase) n=1 Tax=Neolamprologus brichardi TaxID=32507 RepID=A0A3Q4HD86_NEOBR